MRYKLRRITNRSRGQALVEFALVAPIFFMFLFSIIEFGRAVYYIEMLNNAAREGARYAIVHGEIGYPPSGPMPGGIANPSDPTGANIIAATKQSAVGVIGGPADFIVTVRWCSGSTDLTSCPAPLGNGTNARGQNVRVEIAYTYRPIIAGIVPLPTFTLTGGSTLVINH